MTLRAGLAATLLALVLAGCGGGSESSAGAESAASVAPESAVAYASINTDTDSEQWRRADEVLRAFPAREQLLDKVREALAEAGVDWSTEIEPALGPTIEVVALGLEGDEPEVVGLAQPADEAKFKELLGQADEPLVFRTIEGWTAFASTEAVLDRFAQARGDGSLADRDDFSELMAELPDEALVKAWFDADGVGAAAARQLGAAGLGRLQPDAVSLAVEAAEEGGAMEVHVRNDDADVDAPEWGDLAEQVPADAFAFVSGHGHGGQLKVTEQLRTLPGFGFALQGLETQAGVTLEDVASLFNEEMVLWVRPGLLIPEITLALEVGDEAEARATVDRIVAAAGAQAELQRSTRQVGDVEATQLSFGQFAVLYAAFDGKLVVTTQPSGIEAFTGDVDRLRDADAYKDSVEAADVPDGERVLMWVDLQRALGVVETASALGGEPIPSEGRANLAPLRAVVLSADPSFEDGSFRLFVHVR